MKREEMIAVIAGGGSVLHEGRLHTTTATLPSKASLAQSDTERAAAAGDLDAQIAALQAQRDALGGKKSESNELTLEALSAMKRKDLDALAGEKGIENPADYPNIPELAKAVFEKING